MRPEGEGNLVRRVGEKYRAKFGKMLGFAGKYDTLMEFGGSVTILKSQHLKR